MEQTSPLPESAGPDDGGRHHRSSPVDDGWRDSPVIRWRGGLPTSNQHTVSVPGKEKSDLGTKLNFKPQAARSLSTISG